MKVLFRTLGCKLNFAESSAIGKELISKGHERVQKGEQADICVINTCSVTDAADHKGRQLINRIHREHPAAILIVTGCYAQLKPEEIASIPGVDYVLGSNEKFDIPKLVDKLENQISSKAIIKRSEIRKSDIFYPSISSIDRTRCFLKIQDGCNYFCTYCTIPLARGKSRNASIDDIVRQAQQTIDSGMHEIVLTGVNIGDFGRTTNETFIDLIYALDQLHGTFRYRISSIEPNLLSDEIIDFVGKSQHFAPHFHIPLQSGSDEILKIMHRHYDTTLFSERVRHIRQVMPNAFIGVDIMVGVRGETPELFEQSRQYVESLPVSQLHVFTYSERQNTAMLKIDYIVDPTERKRRSDILHEISANKLTNFYKQHKGEKALVLWEEKAKNISTGLTMMTGFTENYIKIERPYEKSKINNFEYIEI